MGSSALGPLARSTAFTWSICALPVCMGGSSAPGLPASFPTPAKNAPPAAPPRASMPRRFQYSGLMGDSGASLASGAPAKVPAPSAIASCAMPVIGSSIASLAIVCRLLPATRLSMSAALCFSGPEPMPPKRSVSSSVAPKPAPSAILPSGFCTPRSMAVSRPCEYPAAPPSTSGPAGPAIKLGTMPTACPRPLPMVADIGLSRASGA